MTDMSTPADGDLAIVLGQRIRQVRKDKGYDSIESFARALGYSWITVSRYERGKSAVSVERLHHIADVLDVPVDALLAKDAA